MYSFGDYNNVKTILTLELDSEVGHVAQGLALQITHPEDPA